jgi:hypothetical protein
LRQPNPRMKLPGCMAGEIGCVAPVDTVVVGFWESDATTRGGIGSAIKLKSDGESLVTATVMVDQVYRISGDKPFVAADKSSVQSVSSGTSFRVTGETVIEFQADGSDPRKQRLGPGGGSPQSLVGAWRYRHYTGGLPPENWSTSVSQSRVGRGNPILGPRGLSLSGRFPVSRGHRPEESVHETRRRVGRFSVHPRLFHDARDTITIEGRTPARTRRRARAWTSSSAIYGTSRKVR